MVTRAIDAIGPPPWLKSRQHTAEAVSDLSSHVSPQADIRSLYQRLFEFSHDAISAWNCSVCAGTEANSRWTFVDPAERNLLAEIGAVSKVEFLAHSTLTK